MINEYPKISIVTVVFNAGKTIEQTIESVVNQTYKNIEYIIIDGGSTDGTIDIVKKYEDRIAYWVSEPDNGIYDAMNKGIDMATGEWIYFIGADDCLFDYDTLNGVSKFMSFEDDILCGCVYLIEKERTFIQLLQGGDLSKEEVYSGRMSPHQGMFVRSKLMKANFFDIRYKIGADFNFFIKMNLENRNIKYIKNVIAFFSNEGISSDIKILYKDFHVILTNYHIKKDHIDDFKTNFQISPMRKNLKYIIKKMGLLGIFKLYILQYEKHQCNLKNCRWCK